MKRSMFYIIATALVAIVASFGTGSSVNAAPGERCNINFGTEPTFATADNGCKYDGASIVGGIPDDWYANTVSGDVQGPAVISASALTLRPKDGRYVPLLP